MDNNPNSIAFILAAEWNPGKGSANHSILLPENRAGLIKDCNILSVVANAPQPYEQGCDSQHDPTKKDRREDREGTLPPDNEYKDCLHLTFDRPPTGDLGFSLGFGKACDVVLHRIPRLSSYHCSLTFDDEYRPILQDHSTYGTVVKYEKKDKGYRRNFRWILGGDPNVEEVKKVVIEFHGDLRFQIIVAKHDTDREEFRSNVKHFRERLALRRDSLPHVGSLDMRINVSTDDTQTPWERPIHLEDDAPLGVGAHGVVYRVWNASNGRVFAAKRPLARKHLKIFEAEIEILSNNQHKNIVQLMFDIITDGMPELILEFSPFETLREQIARKTITKGHSFAVLMQSLSALDFLHRRENPIVHQDIKPRNILVHSWEPFQIKLADFGIAKAEEDVLTICGTKLYMAPEFFSRDLQTRTMRERYGAMVDIWSLGVVVLECRRLLPGFAGPRESWEWCTNIFDHGRANVRYLDRGWNLIGVVVTCMLQTLPEYRHSAERCIEESQKSPEFPESLNPVPAVGTSTPSESTEVESSEYSYHAPATPFGPPTPPFIPRTPRGPSLQDEIENATVRGPTQTARSRSRVTTPHGADDSQNPNTRSAASMRRNVQSEVQGSEAPKGEPSSSRSRPR
ncbi:hypothetical protein MMC25_007276 [Agyrium rufum]|nr:hypothetical protein [Agyrium rufum]